MLPLQRASCYSEEPMLSPLSGRCRRARRAVAAAELALLLPFLIVAFVAAVDFARVFYYSLTITNCARNGAVYGSADATHALDQTGIASAVASDASNLNSANLHVNSSTDSTTKPTYVTVTVTYPFSMITSFPGMSSQRTLSRTVRMLVVPTTPNFN